jgi:hypothetical protein
LDVRVLEEVLYHIHNWFVHEQYTVSGCKVEGGVLPASIAIPQGAWYRVEGSLLNDGLHRKDEEDELEDETFSGKVSVLAIPKALLAVVEDIEEWKRLNRDAELSPYSSESFNGYRYQLKGAGRYDGTGAKTISGWRSLFADALNPWRKMQ